jgi:hypothetical protein
MVHALRTLIGQRIVGLALGYEDVNDHDDIRFDPVLALWSNRLAPRRFVRPLPKDRRRRERDRGAVRRALLDAHAEAPKAIVLDATDDPLHGSQKGRFFHGYYDLLVLSAALRLLRRHLLAATSRRWLGGRG